MSNKSFSGKELAKHLILISIDALSESDWETAISLPHLAKLLNKGSYTNSLKSVFPTHTYVVHTSIVTGVYPDKHGIIHNHQFQPFVPDKDQKWYWFQDEIKVPTIYDLAKENKMTTAGLFWPVTGRSSLTYNMPELAAIKGENQALKILKNGTLSFIINLELKFGKKRVSTRQPYLDDFTTLCAIDTIKRKKPNLMLIHFCDLDSAKHNFGIESPEIQKSLIRLDNRVGDIAKAVEESGLQDDTVIIVIGDHGQFTVNYNVHLNNLLRDAGLIYEEGGQLKWKAYLQTTGGNAYLHIKDNDNKALKLALDVLNKASQNDIFGIEEIYNRKKLDELNAPKEVNYVVEAKVGYHFDDSLSKETIQDYKKLHKPYATHGYSPEKPGYKCIFIAQGPGIKEDYSIGPIEMVDIAPTISRILGMDFYKCDGRIITEMFD